MGGGGRHKADGTAQTSQNTTCEGKKEQPPQKTCLLTQKMKLKKKSMYLIHLVQPSTPMVDVGLTDMARG